MPVIRSISGLRATVDDNSLHSGLVRDYCMAFSKVIPEGDIIIGSDGRPSGKGILEVATNALVSCGRNVRLAGVVPTPTVQLLVEKSDAVGGIIITASHNPAQWNGLKFIDGNGVFLDARKNKELWHILDNKLVGFNTASGVVSEIKEALDMHLESVLQIDMLKENLDALKSMKLRAVVDAVNASGSVFIPALLDRLGIDVVKLFCDRSGIFPHLPEPLPQNLTELAEEVRRQNADLGIAVDPDADRLVLIDENGNPIGEELTVALAVESVLSSRQGKSEKTAVVVNLSTTRLVEDIANKYGADFYRSAVGEINVVKKMQEVGAVIGGEGSGGVIYPSCHYGRDSLVGIGLVLSLMASRNKSPGSLVKDFPKYEIVKYKQDFTGDVKNLTHKLAEHYSASKVDLNDGIRIDFADSWVQLRASNTEPIIRIIAEAPTKAQAEKLIDNLLRLI